MNKRYAEELYLAVLVLAPLFRYEIENEDLLTLV